MKFLILLTLVSLNAFANQVPLSEAQRYIEAMPNGVPPLWSCSDKPEEPCFNTDDIIWEHAEIVTVHEEDPKTGINTPRKILRNSEVKKLKNIKDADDKKLAKKALKEAAEADFDKANSIAALKAAFKKLREAEKE